jgi:predicted membrane protein
MVDFEKREIKGGCPGFTGPFAPGMVVGLLLIAGGTLLFLDNLNVLPFQTAKAFWPLALLAYSAAWMYGSLAGNRSAAVMVWAGTGIVAGILLLLGNYGVVRVSLGNLWPLTLIASGILMMIYRLRWRHFKERLVIGSISGRRSTTMSRVQEHAVFSAVKRKIESPQFEGGELSSLFGSIEIDMRWAAISSPDNQIVIEANALFGSIELRIPDSWKVQLLGNAVFGAYEDKTIPPRPEQGVKTPTLVIRGGTAFGAVEVRN